MRSAQCDGFSGRTSVACAVSFMESNGTPPNGNEKITRSPERDLGFLGPVANSEFEDESPGSYLAELGVRRWNVVWSIGNLIVTAAAAICLRLNIESLALDVVWKLCPVSCVLLLLITLWQRASRYTQSAVGKSRLSLALTAVSYTHLTLPTPPYV